MNKKQEHPAISQSCNLENLGQWFEAECQVISDETVREMVLVVGKNTSSFFRWPEKAELLWEGCDRIAEKGKKQKYHPPYPDIIQQYAKEHKIHLDRRSNGPAIAAFQIAGGDRPKRYATNNLWSIHHIYQNKFIYPGQSKTLHAVKRGLHFTQSAGLVAVHPLADQLCDEFPFVSWFLRAEAYQRFGYDPDNLFSMEEHDDFGFLKPRHCTIWYKAPTISNKECLVL